MTLMGDYMFSPTPRACLSSVQVHRLGYQVREEKRTFIHPSTHPPIHPPTHPPPLLFLQNRVPHALAAKSTLDVTVVEGEATQCIYAKDRALMRREFPNSYGLPMVHLHSATGGPEPSSHKLQQATGTSLSSHLPTYPTC